MSAIAALGAVLLDWLIGEPRRWHPLVWFGRLANAIEARLYGAADVSTSRRRIRGAVALALATLPLTAAAWLLATLPYVGLALGLLMLYFSIGHKSLHQHAHPVAIALINDKDDEARRLVCRMVSRDAATLDVIPATIESVLENGNDAVFATLFWFALGGAPGAILYRLVNTLDAMWGYRNERYLHFGWAAARCDDVMNYLPARLTALTYALLGKTRQALDCWKTQATDWESPNAGPVMASGAGALGIRIGGPARYHGQWRERPLLGVAAKPQPQDIDRSLRLVSHGMYLWLALFLITAGIFHA